ncbi:MAG: hypothetical protein EHM58_01400 [Ignavibacteriae bacterium]|nr:MAG: hypothetical protein EHM58_01400 [Ignavibacteriota bacterium]
MPSFKILSIDGGGVRGVYPAAVLDYVQQRQPEPIQEYFDLIVGTSTGAIIALALALGISTSEILNLYKNRSTSIFRKKSLSYINQGIIMPKYSNAYLLNELKDLFKEAIINDCNVRVCIPTIDIVNGKTIVRKTRHLEEYQHDFVLPVWQVAAESSAAPIYLPAFEDENSCQYIDGGLWANNPAMVGVAEALKIGHSLEDIKVLSIGTGFKPFFKDGWKTKWLGLIGYRTTLVDITFQTQSQGVHNTVTYLLKDGNYLRIDKILPKAKKWKFFSKFGLDDTGSINTLIGFANNEAKENISKIQKVFLQTKVSAFTPIPLIKSEVPI